MFLLNLHDHSRHFLTEDQWIAILEFAKSAGWEPMGSVLDLAFQLFIHPEPNYLFESQLFVTLYLHHYCLNWNGDYHTPEYQIVRDDDAQNLHQALEYVGADKKIVEFIKKGSFRICPD
ncbi:MAG: hypothetical protein N2316_12145 [Spirochaetes bacterium]|nr:hypothetical protein [Spirochaetota bacterium]